MKMNIKVMEIPEPSERSWYKSKLQEADVDADGGEYFIMWEALVEGFTADDSSRRMSRQM